MQRLQFLKGTSNGQLGTKKIEERERDYTGRGTGSEDLALKNPGSDVAASKHDNHEKKGKGSWLILMPMPLPTWRKTLIKREI